MKVACIFFQKEARLNEFAQACLRFSPQITVRNPNVILIEIGKCMNLYSEASFIARIGILLRRFSFEAKISISTDIPSAIALSRFGGKSLEDLPLEALLDFGDPFGADPIGKKSLEKMIESLKRLGLRTLRDFKSIPVNQVPSRFGSLGLFCRQRIADGSNLPWPHWEPPETYIEQVDLLPSEHCSYLEPLLFKAKEVLDRLFSRLRGKFLRAEKLSFTIELEKYSTVKQPVRTWNFEFISPQSSTIGFLPMLRERLNWDLAKAPIESSVTLIRCEVTAFTVATNAQRNFFHTRDDFNEALGSLFGQIEEYLGKGQVFWSQVTEERFPEKSWERARKGCTEHPDLLGRYPLRPTRIFKKPIPVTLIQDRLVFKGRTFKTTTWSSVERLALDWIDEAPARNYYRVTLEGGPAIWVFSDPGHHFFAHGYFE